ncbi:zinc transport system substrate-binding protein [Saccharopolyspora shandongensis]|uniref:Zinc transport system substrate-binding protein n=1 Tax=Saccharopolyspora shandongensis TaxID=418495 RepID=A0A1H3KEX5_9PSEU|nr:hypothetical protein [Saccharopolyspora shandongensis]SDY50355.1 zinc transport system substrate-binding protein [Saccharopolyspora shandongensis]
MAGRYVTYISQLAGADVVGTYGPQPVTPAQLADLSAKQPDLVLDNAHMSTGPVLPGSPAKQVSLINYPEENLDLLDVYRTDAQRIVEALRP